MTDACPRSWYGTTFVAWTATGAVASFVATIMIGSNGRPKASA